MLNDIVVFNLRDCLFDENKDNIGEDELYKIFSEFSCSKNLDVERFLKEQSIDFTKKNQSVTYLVFSEDTMEFLGYFTLAIKPIAVYSNNLSNTMKRKIARVSKFNEETNTYTLSAYLIAQIGKNFQNGVNQSISGKQLLQAAIDTIKELQYMVGGMVFFLEAENNENLLNFYEQENGFKQFNVKETESKTRDSHTLVQLLKII